MTNKDKITILIIAIMLALAGYFLGRSSVKQNITLICPERVNYPVIKQPSNIQSPLQTS